jgi:zona occludens toxin (predicted ATPase)
MTLSLIVGKPGSGKSYFAVKRIIQELIDFCHYELNNNEQYERLIFTNLVLNYNEIDKYVSNSIGEIVEASKYIFFMDNDFFFDVDHKLKIVNRKKWWQDIPESAFCVIDEVHHYLSADSGTTREEKDYLESFRNYMSTHRHFKHDHIFITQHTDSIQRSVLAMAADAYHIINLKNKVVPLLNIPFSDLDVVKESFGISHQYIQVLYGNYLSRSFKRESVFCELLNPSIYVLYKSHTLTTGKAEDRPSLKLTPLSACIWFLRRHGFNLCLKIGFVVFCFFLVWKVLVSIPNLFDGVFSSSRVEKVVESQVDVNNNVESNMSFSNSSEKLVDYNIYGFVRDGVLTNFGLKKVGDFIVVDSKKKVIKSIDFLNGVVSYED